MEPFSNYKLRLKKLIALLGYEHSRFIELLTLQARLEENISRAQKYGDMENIRSERMQILESLNSLSLDTLKISFNDLAQVEVYSNDRSTGQTLQQSVSFGTRIPDVGTFYGRDEELNALKKMVIETPARVVGIFGIAGIGKTTVAASLIQQVKDDFEYKIWYSLLNPPLLQEIVSQTIKVLSRQQDVYSSENTEESLSRLISYLEKNRCLLVLDNFESVFVSGGRVGEYLEGFEGYGSLLHRMAEIHHRSCLILTSREKPKEFLTLEDEKSLVKSIVLTGLKPLHGSEILRNKGLVGENRSLHELVSRYSGNPLALKLISETIRDLFRSNVDDFMLQEASLPVDVGMTLEKQFNRLSTTEKDVVFWLAIEREGTSMSELRRDTNHLMSEKELLDALTSLRRRSLVDITSGGFSLPNVVMEYITGELIERACNEIRSGDLRLLVSHALVKAQTKEHIRSSQIRLILNPVIDSLEGSLRKPEIESGLSKILSAMQMRYGEDQYYYAAGNIVNILVQFEIDLDGRDFSNLAVWQAYLKKASLRDTNFTSCDFTGSAFTETLGQILSVRYSPDGKLLAASTANGEIILWKLDDFMRLRTYQGHDDWVRSVRFDSSGEYIVSACDDNTLRLWNVDEGFLVKTMIGHKGWALCATFNKGNEIIASGEANGDIRLWRAESGECIRVLEGHTRWVRGIDFSPDGSVLATGSEDLTVRLWNWETGQCRRIIQGFTDNITCIEFSPDGKQLGVGCYDGLRLLNVESGKIEQELKGHSHRVFSLAFSQSGRLLASGSEDTTVKIWDTKTGESIDTLQGHSGKVYSVAFSPDNQRIASGSEDQSIRIWEVGIGKCISILRGYTNWVWSAVLNASETLIASGTEDGVVRLWNLSTGNCEKELLNHGSRVNRLVFDSESSTLYSAREDHSILVWNMGTEKIERVLKGHTSRIRTMAVSPDNTILASAGEAKHILLWNVKHSVKMRSLEGHGSWVHALSFNPAGDLLASCSEDNTIKIWNIGTGECVKTFPLDTPVWTLVFGRKGDMIISGGEDNQIRLWNTETEQCIKVLEGHTAPLYASSLSLDGNLLATGGFDRTARLWNLTTGECLRVFQGHEGWIWSVNLNHSGDLLVTGSADETIKIWNTSTGKCLETLRSDRPYERMNITRTVGLSEAQKALLIQLGAFDEAGK